MWLRSAASCFNAFSRVDVRVEVKIPGGVDGACRWYFASHLEDARLTSLCLLPSAYVIDLRGERHEATPAIWQETYVSALLRAIRYADDANYRLAG